MSAAGEASAAAVPNGPAAGAGMMRGALRVGPRQMVVHDLPRPQLEPGTAIVRVVAAGVCGSDLHGYREGGQPETRPQGHEVAGEVVALAREADGAVPLAAAGRGTVREGDLVALDTICLGRACGECHWCAQ